MDLALVGLVAFLAVTSDSKAQVVPGGAGIELDGKIGAEEWEGAARLGLEKGGELLLRHDGTHLYLAVRSPTPGLVHVYLAREDEIRVHHASAALGTARYARDDLGAWQPTQSFPTREAWTLREAALTEEVRAKRQAHLGEQGWVASNASMNPKEFEFAIARANWTPETRLAAAFLTAPAPLAWPERLADGCVERRLLSGTTPSDLRFEPETWLRLEFQALPEAKPAAGK